MKEQSLFGILLLCLWGTSLGDDGSRSERGRVRIGDFSVPDYPINVTVTATDPPYCAIALAPFSCSLRHADCVTFVGREDKGLGEEGCASYDELGRKGLHFFRMLVGNAQSMPPLIVDVGANIGSHSNYAAALGARVIAIEPHPFHARRLFHMAHLNDWNLQVFSGGAHDFDGTGVIHILKGGHLVMRKVEEVGEPNLTTVRTINIELTRIDTLVGNDEMVVFLKIDTDGHELQALRGATRLFEEERVKYMKIEFVPYALEMGNAGSPTAAMDLLTMLDQHEGEFFCVHDLRPLRREAFESFVERYKYKSSFLVMPRSNLT
ncbi:hypothetical protein GUITHDRAFT_137627 [Guillardia theta CCMP2712]|uniref:Methyltransferase FkbM domain-containing protein n=1 Tax=Guillardia theta (strain CCMP2712) TaxID=905079 RepID=L1JH51_GUITC|nr:hypothetical protein GUITHDRAFT_137627 [Guillardia theta CCMP2712]EKX47474.1 hypothetical protein GUITHDRAFT_137627 [Guillardia theta CCMP2712]|eukprot:XP_005834454.1 hypothetical protein GUITHDRAFT_137627 [Guillardia theta CCMP2712]